jgi:spectinomycin phosphotransferase
VARLAEVLADGWGLRTVSLEYVPEGGGSYHWAVTDAEGQRWFATVDDLGGKDWFVGGNDAVFDGLRRALSTAAALRYEAGLQFVIAPVAACDGQPLRRVGETYSASVFPFLPGASHPFGPYTDERVRGQVLDMIAALHQATPAVRDRAPGHVLCFAGREELEAFVLSPDRAWDGGPFAETARGLLLPLTADLAQLVTAFDRLAASTRPARGGLVITHGEPHPANIMTAGGRLVLIDWDTVALAPPERDVSLIVTDANRGVDRYQQATGRELIPAVITLYRLRWYLDDLASAVRLFRNTHRDTPDTTRWRNGLARSLEQLPEWLDRLS